MQSDTMRHRTSEELYKYWNHVRGTRPAPKRFEIEPSKIAGILPSTFILEQNNTDAYRFRLAGTRMCEIIGTELRDTDFLDGWPSEDRLLLNRSLSVLTSQAATVLIHFEASARNEQPVEFELLLLPLFHTQETIDRILGCCSPLDVPSWLGDEPLLTKRLLDNEFAWPNRDPQTLFQGASADTPTDSYEGNTRIVRSAHRRFVVFEGGLDRPTREEI